MNVAIYCRVSTLEQKEHGYSIEEQERKLKQFCEINDWNVADVFVDAGFSGAKRDRPELQRLMNDIKRFDLVLVYKLDRLTRNVRDLLDLLEIFEQNNVAFRSATEVYDTSTAMGRLFVTLVGAMAEWERETIRERTQMGKLAALKKGIMLTTPPFYYDRVDNKFVPNKYKEVVLFAYEEALKGKSAKSIARKLNNSDIPPPNNRKWEDRSITRALRSPFTRGHFEWGGVYLENNHEAIITEEMYEKVKDRLEERTNTKKIKHVSIFRSKLVCPVCDSKLTMNTHKVTLKDRVYYNKHYYCNNCKETPNAKPVYIRAEEVERVFYEYLQHQDLTRYEVVEDKEEKEVAIDINKIMQQRKRYHKLYANGLMNEDELAELIEETDIAIEEYKKQSENREVKQYNSEDIKQYKNLLLEMWDISSDEEKAEFIQMAIKNIFIEYVLGKNDGKRKRRSLKIKDIEFY